MERVLITGAGRGIGLGLVRAYAEHGDHVLAGYRESARAGDLSSLAALYPEQVTMVPFEVTSLEAVEQTVAAARERYGALDVLINNAGIGLDEWSDREIDGQKIFDPQRSLQIFHVNAVAPLVIAQACTGLLTGGSRPRVINISSDSGSLAQKTEGEPDTYGASKAALNMYSRMLAWDLRSAGIIVVALHPGWVQSDMGGAGALLTLEQSARKMLSVIDSLTPADTGRYLQYDGTDLPW
jgi:NAD(P)-dependent dehydrogenase (short-subunit alcohol dehydrogenase family)